MGNTQFYSPLKTSVDEIKTLTNTISTNVNEVEIVVNDLKNTDIGNLNTKVDQLSTTNKGIIKATTNSGYYSPAPIKLLDITGKGWLVGVSNNSGGGASIGLQIDGSWITLNSNDGNTYYNSMNINNYYTPISLRFESNVKVFSSQTAMSFLYTLD